MKPLLIEAFLPEIHQDVMTALMVPLIHARCPARRFASYLHPANIVFHFPV
jgi:hypothetical protein